MSTKAQAILDEQRFAPTSGELYGEPLTDEDIEQSARVTFQMLDEEYPDPRRTKLSPSNGVLYNV
jgi:hypothetical protein